jgi:hypothetical protein
MAMRFGLGIGCVALYETSEGCQRWLWLFAASPNEGIKVMKRYRFIVQIASELGIGFRFLKRSAQSPRHVPTSRAAFTQE